MESLESSCVRPRQARARLHEYENRRTFAITVRGNIESSERSEGRCVLFHPHSNTAVSALIAASFNGMRNGASFFLRGM
jgi:hypothetical protein